MYFFHCDFRAFAYVPGRMTLHLRSFTGGLAVSVLLFFCLPLAGQDANLRQFDPSDVYFQGWLKVRDGERAVEADKFLDAYNHYDKAANLFDTVALYHPEWQAELVKDRQDSTRKATRSNIGPARSCVGF